MEQYNRRFLLCTSANNPLVKQKKIDRSMLENQVAVLYGDYETSFASYKVLSSVSDIILSSKRVYVYDRSSAMDTLSLCPNNYMWITGLHNSTLSRYNLVLRECDGINDRNIGYHIYYSLEEMNPKVRELLSYIEGIDWTEIVS